MKCNELLVSGLSITEDEYHYKGLFILGTEDRALNCDISELEDESRLREIKDYFSLEEEPDEIRRVIMDLVMEKASISSKNSEGEKYGEDLKRKKSEKIASSLDLS